MDRTLLDLGEAGRRRPACAAHSHGLLLSCRSTRHLDPFHAREQRHGRLVREGQAGEHALGDQRAIDTARISDQDGRQMQRVGLQE